MSDYNFENWLQTQFGQDKDQIRRNGLKATADAELRVKGLRPPVEGIPLEKCDEFSKRVKNLLVLLGWGLKPRNVSDRDWQSFQPLCKELVDKNQMDAKTLELF